MLICILDLTESNITNLIHTHKFCNWDLYKKNEQFLSKIKIIYTNKGDTESITNYPVFCYLIVVFSCMFYEYNIYTDTSKNKLLGIKMLIVSVIDLFNTIMLINSQNIQSKHFIYQIISSRFFSKMNTLYKNIQLLSQVRNKEKKPVEMFKESSHSFLLTELKSKYTLKTIKSINRYPYRKKYPDKKKDLIISENVISKIKLEKKLQKKNTIKIPTINIDYTYKIVSKVNNSLEELVTYLGNYPQTLVVHFDHLGLKLDKPIVIKWNDLKHEKDKFFFTIKNIKMYFDNKNLFYIGFTEGSKDLLHSKNILYGVKNVSLKDKLKFLGFTKETYNITDSLIDKIHSSNLLVPIDTIKKSKMENKKLAKECISEILNERLININSSINHFRININKIKNGSKDNLLYKKMKIDDLFTKFLSSKIVLPEIDYTSVIYNVKNLNTDFTPINYICDEFLKLIKNNKEMSDLILNEIKVLIISLIENQYNYHLDGTDFYFNKVLTSKALTSGYDSKIDELVIIQETPEEPESNEDGDIDVAEGINDIDVENMEGEFDVAEDDA
jgi:hypothetical protein